MNPQLKYYSLPGSSNSDSQESHGTGESGSVAKLSAETGLGSSSGSFKAGMHKATVDDPLPVCQKSRLLSDVQDGTVFLTRRGHRGDPVGIWSPDALSKINISNKLYERRNIYRIHLTSVTMLM
jgi:hypothetical protein